ncbi:hypothetical protein O6H91_02G136200 [Diphasiastrum complanatum]|uniref:Uncharacterized protein n=2 Tax=Diphasiastrum complanatum TaxID=34168 RepID=A0ACC2EL66_DIPCM|nr:hypothetical protein O6H91_02G136200 [Diphasiastrum complanatum]KAJ7567198.1 hypothetical protein O6H91_02G136200 [Diphasiastrum complanatum]
MVAFGHARIILALSGAGILLLQWGCVASQELSRGSWATLLKNSGVSAMHMVLTHNNKVIIFDRTDFGPSNISLPSGKCRNDPNDTALKTDCWAHSIEYDIATNSVRPLTIETDTWCSSGALLADGRLVQMGGYNDGAQVVRYFSPCERCDWFESPSRLSVSRWYATAQILPDNRVIVVGGIYQFSYEFVPKQTAGETVYQLPFLLQTADSFQNNLYPFVYLSSDGNLFIFANADSILLDYSTNKIVRRFPTMPGMEARNYPSSGSSVMLPLEGETGYKYVEILVCGGASSRAYLQATNGTFTPASQTCGRLKITDANPKWEMETMPIHRVMGDMLLLPTGDVLIINGAQSGTAGWFLARGPVLSPLLYKPKLGANGRFQLLTPSQTPRLYHSTAAVLPDGRILVGGSNPNPTYAFSNVLYPTELSLEAFSPPYLDPAYASRRPTVSHISSTILRHGNPFSLYFSMEAMLSEDSILINLLAPPFTSHSFSMNHRVLQLKILQVTTQLMGKSYEVVTETPTSTVIAPAGYYILYLVHAGLPSQGIWVHLSAP